LSNAMSIMLVRISYLAEPLVNDSLNYKDSKVERCPYLSRGKYLDPTICWKLLKLTSTQMCNNLVDVTMDNQQETEKDPQRLHVGDLVLKIKI
jgi:hypothetical protein